MLSVALVDAAIKDSDIVSVFRALHNLMLRVISNPFLSLLRSFHATPAKAVRHTEESLAGLPPKESPPASSDPASSPSTDAADKSGAKKDEKAGEKEEGAKDAERQGKTQVSSGVLCELTKGSAQ